MGVYCTYDFKYPLISVECDQCNPLRSNCNGIKEKGEEGLELTYNVINQNCILKNSLNYDIKQSKCEELT